MLAKLILAAAMAVLICAAPARADSVDGNPTHPADRNVPASVRGSPAILFENVLGPLDACNSDDGSGSCGAQGKF